MTATATDNRSVSHKETFTLPCKISDEERIDFGRKLAQANTELTQAEMRKKEAASQFGAVIERTKAEANRIANIISTGEEYRAVECEIILDYDAGRALTFRTDIEEVTDSRPLTRDERQLRIVTE